MSDDGLETCPGCGVELPPVATSGHPYLGASASCWAQYGEVLAREYGNPRYMTVHRLTVDAYAAQHPGEPERRTIQSAHVHLLGLCLTLERGWPADRVTRRIAALTGAGASGLAWLSPPKGFAALTVADVAGAATPEEHARRIERWARSVWANWRSHHDHIRLTAVVSERLYAGALARHEHPALPERRRRGARTCSGPQSPFWPRWPM